MRLVPSSILVTAAIATIAWAMPVAQRLDDDPDGGEADASAPDPEEEAGTEDAGSGGDDASVEDAASDDDAGTEDASAPPDEDASSGSWRAGA